MVVEKTTKNTDNPTKNMFFALDANEVNSLNSDKRANKKYIDTNINKEDIIISIDFLFENNLISKSDNKTIVIGLNKTVLNQ